MVFPLKTRFNQILKDWVSPLAKLHGFRKKGNIYFVSKANMSWMFEIQMDQRNNSEKIEFTINCGIYVPGVIETYINGPQARPLKIQNCCVYSRLGLLAEDRLDKWWVISVFDETPTQLDQIIGQEIHLRLNNEGFIFLQRFCDLQSLLSFLEIPRIEKDKHIWPVSDAIALAYAGILYSIMDCQNDIERLMVMALEKARDSPVENVIENLFKRIQSG